MSYLERSLGENETLIAVARFHWLYWAGAWCALVLSLAAAAFLFASVQAPVSAVILAGFGLAVFLAIMIPVWTTEIGVTSQRLVVKRGFLTQRTEEVELWAIEEVDLEQDLLGRLFGFGSIVVQGTGDDEMRIPAIAAPLVFRKAVQTAISQSRPADRVPRPAS
jgi:uncharacterized membrane protein YdbT with pleckstrin-like domain